MIITKEFAEKLDKETLAELATKYCNELAEKLGSDKKIKINPEEIIYKENEAKYFFTDSYLKTKVQEKQPFLHYSTAYTPLANPSLREKLLIFRIAGGDKSREYITIRGFGAEMGHILGKKLYGNKKDSGLGEALDCLSQLHEISADVRTVFESEGISNNHELENLLVCETLVGARERLDTYETILFEGEDSAIKKLSKICQSEAKNMLKELKQDYTTTKHFEGIKLMISVYDNENFDINRTYRKIGELLSDQKVNTTLDALKRLYNQKPNTVIGYLKKILSPNKELSKYKDVFGNDISTRMARLNKNKCLRNKPDDYGGK